MYKSTKLYPHSLGISCAFRQWRANHSHCHWIHGYALAFKFTFACLTPDERHWVVDFGSLKGLKQKLVDTFDHKLVVAQDDPHLDIIASLQGLDIADVLVVPRVGIEAFARIAFNLAVEELVLAGRGPNVWVESCEVFEHESNSAIYIAEPMEFPKLEQS